MKKSLFLACLMSFGTLVPIACTNSSTTPTYYNSSTATPTHITVATSTPTPTLTGTLPPTSTPTVSPTPTQTAAPPFSNSGASSIAVTVAAASGGANAYNPSSVTITAGQSVYFNINNHTATFDDSNGNCLASGNFGGGTTVTFPGLGTYNYHCSIPGHSSCNSAQCSGCTGIMVGKVVVQ